MSFPNGGVLLVALVGIGLVVALALFDVYFIRRSGQPVGRWVQAWARRYPILAFLLVMILGMLVGHFYWSTQPPCPTLHPGQAPPAATEPDCIHQLQARQPSRP